MSEIPLLGKAGVAAPSRDGPVPLTGADGVVGSTSDNRWLDQHHPGAVNKLGGGPSPPGRGRREAPGEGRKSSQILRPSPYPLPEGEGESSGIRIFSELL